MCPRPLINFRIKVNRWLSFEQRAINPGETRVIIYAVSSSPGEGISRAIYVLACPRDRVLRDKRNRRYDQSRFRRSRNRGSAIPRYRTMP